MDDLIVLREYARFPDRDHIPSWAWDDKAGEAFPWYYEFPDVDPEYWPEIEAEVVVDKSTGSVTITGLKCNGKIFRMVDDG